MSLCTKCGVPWTRAVGVVRHCSSSVSADIKTANYPPIVDNSYLAKRGRALNDYHEKFKTIKTVEEKMIGVNMPKLYGFKCVELNEDKIPIQALKFIQHSTRTHLIVQDKLPEYYIDYDTPASFIAKELQGEIEDAIKFEFQLVKRTFENDITPRQKAELISSCVLQQINRIITNHLASKLPHIMDCQIDLKPRIEAAWVVGGFDTPIYIKEFRKSKSFLKPLADAPHSHYMQFKGDPVMTLRSELPLEPILPSSEADNPSLEVPVFNYGPQTIGFFFNRQHVTNIPGFWPGDSSEFGLLSYHKREHLLERSSYLRPKDHADILNCQGILASFAWLFAQCCYQGFTTYNELTYPLVTQTIITDAQYWSFYIYQLNTVLMNNHHITTNPLRNICYGTNSLKLFEGIDNNGKVFGFNEDVLKMIIQLYINAPKEREGVDMKPYLGKDVNLVADIDHEEKRCWLEKKYKHVMSNRTGNKVPYEIYLWERIYKVKFQTRFQEKRRRPFETFNELHPNQRRLDQHYPGYVSKAERPDKPKKVGRTALTYYPDI